MSTKACPRPDGPPCTLLLCLTDDVGVELDLAPLGGEGDGDVDDPGPLLDVCLDGVDARGAGHAADLEDKVYWCTWCFISSGLGLS